METIELEYGTKKLLEALAEQEHISVNEIINRLLNTAAKEKLTIPDDEENRQHLLDKLRNIKPVKSHFSTEQIVRSLRDGTALE
ncbi:MAG: hypothetical protein HOP21_08215 [Methylotenera sp.]|nr:hypothetical protein [Methylotenera sp.]